MQRHIHILTAFITIARLGVQGQDLPLMSIDASKISSETELNFSKTDKRGIESESKVVYYVESDMQTITAFQRGLVDWKVNIIRTCGKPEAGDPTIRCIKLINDKILVTYGKHSYAEVNINTGNTHFLGSD